MPRPQTFARIWGEAVLGGLTSTSVAVELPSLEDSSTQRGSFAPGFHHVQNMALAGLLIVVSLHWYQDHRRLSPTKP
eukprot:CAMPEP_0173415064 /NCGR_PEP_ID=MMETSP1356-20130122/84661_1 /TAXON_ID=77927 ORGANISM="Hemiselmis virescens, Strain PCC157" /NCGR_SAMPLE_ID=MMETSP1356 /ASSEMBLY_ACC=CAM_ASM_000847 /LENGTH=76 /DNA_ID=CAMNT_0014377287 /DNA_START=579 /DNA_END=809 /DNA_ORIENTATION=-